MKSNIPSTLQIIVFISIVCSIILILTAGPTFCEKTIRKKTPYRFDTGLSSSAFLKGDILLTPKDIYHTEKGFGWIEPPEDGFLRFNLQRSRNEFTIDGVEGERLSFQADLAPGEWWITLWIEAGTEDSSTIKVFINEERKNPRWQVFRPPAEPLMEIQDIFRLYHGHVTINSNGLHIELAGTNDRVRLLGFTLIPHVQPTMDIHHSMLRLIESAGTYGSSLSLESILTGLKDLLAQNPEDSFAYYWYEQIGFLSHAERYMNFMGWEWASEETGLGIFSRYHQAVMILDGLLNEADMETYPLYERVLWQRGRLLYWLGEERYGPHEIAGGRRDLNELYQRYPDDSLLAIYNGVKVDQPDPCDHLEKTPNAPAWSVAQREALCRLRQVAHWWVEERQADNGEFGGKLDDDVELLRWWSSLILSGDTTALEGWRRLAEGVWNSPKVYKGYSKIARDVEHASELIADTAPEMVIYDDDSTYTDKLRHSLHYFDTLWTGLTPKGNRFFRSAWFSSQEINTDPPKNRDLEYNTRAVKAVRYLAWRTGDAKAIELLYEWSKAWVNAAMCTDKGKPAGIIPASVRFPDEAINGDEPTWYIANMLWDYYDWSWHVGSMMMDQLIFTYTMTADENLLKPVFAALDLVGTYVSTDLNPRSPESTAPGSPEWAAAELRTNKDFWTVVSQWRLSTGETRYDDLFLHYGSPYLRYRLTGDGEHLIEGLDSLFESIRYNVPLLTLEVLHTDRVNVRGAHHLKAMLTGDGISSNMSPFFAVSWENTDDTFTALVTETGEDKLGVQLFSHSKADDEITMRLWQVEPGTYRLSIGIGEEILEENTIKVQTLGQRVPIVLPGQRLITVTLEKRDD